VKHGESVLVRDAPCAKCGCYAAKHFECNCGEVHGRLVREALEREGFMVVAPGKTAGQP